MSQEAETATDHKRGLSNFQPPPAPKDLNFTVLDSVKDYLRHFRLTDKTVEEKFLSMLPFFPESDSTRTASLINTPISNNNYIHELCIENTDKSATFDDGVKDIVLIHGYAANLGLFFNNFDALSSIPGVKVHAIDLLGFGFSSRPSFPNFKNETVEDITKIEDWFIDAIEEWRKERNINHFILMGHSFGGYLSACYALKYNKPQTDGQNLLSKMILISPVGVERNKFSFLKNLPNPFMDDEEVKRQNENTKGVQIENEVTADQTELTNHTINPKYLNLEDEDDKKILSRRTRIIRHLWQKNVSPFSILRASGPLKSKFVSVWTSRRFAEYYNQDPNLYRDIHDYFYRTFVAKGSGEYAITRVLAIGALPRLPLMDRIPQFVTKTNLPTLWCYGDVDWMNVEAGREMVDEINQMSGSKLAKFGVVPQAGHHLYLDNPDSFHKLVFDFLGYN